MPASFTIDVVRRIVLSRGQGVLVDDDLRETQKGVRDAPGFDADFRQLHDFSEVTDVEVDQWPAVGHVRIFRDRESALRWLDSKGDG